MGHDVDAFLHGVVTEISIHVPAWGTTFVDGDLEVAGLISIHVPAWGTTDLVRDRPPALYFNPRARVGHDMLSLFSMT